jgi:hypothetical protein
MPGGDRSGPLGQGPMTGRRMGFCTGFNMYETSNRLFGRGFGFGRGRGIGFRRYARPYPESYPVQYSAADEAEILRNQAKDLKASLEMIEGRLSQLDKESSKKENK